MGNYFASQNEKRFETCRDVLKEIYAIKDERAHTRRKLDLAEKIAFSRHLADWISVFYVTNVAYSYILTKSKRAGFILWPFLPLTFLLVYEIDSASGNQQRRISEETEKILKFEQHLLKMPSLQE